MKTLCICLCFLLFSFCSNAQDPGPDFNPLSAGEKLPEVTLRDSLGTELALTEITKGMPSVIVVYRGAWCGYCTQHLSALQDMRPYIDSLGFQIFGVSPDRPSKLAESSSDFEGEFPVYSDSQMELIRALRLNWKVGEELFLKYKNDYKLDLEDWSGEDHHELPVPAVYIVVEDEVRYRYANPDYSVRLDTEDLKTYLIWHQVND